MSNDWETRQLGTLAKNEGDYGSGAAALEFDINLPRYVRITDITDDGRLDPNSWASIRRGDAEGYYLSPNDLLFARSGATVGKTYLYNESEGECAYAGYVIKFSLDPDLCDPRFVAQWVRSNVYWSWVQRTLRQGAQPNINAQEYKSIELPYPPLDEQRCIAEILDTIDDAIQKTEAVIAKLKQMRDGLLHDLLTRGLDENGKLRDPIAHPEQFKDSQLGRIPRGWETERLGKICDLQVGYAFKSQWFEDQKGIRLLRGENVGYGTPDWSDTRRLAWKISPMFKDYELSAGDIIIGMDRPFTKQGFKVSVLTPDDVPSLLVQRVGRFISTECNASYLRGLLGSSFYHRALMAQQKGMDIPHVSKSEILEPRIGVPPDEEQHRIANLLDAHDTRIRTEVAYCDKLKGQKKGMMDDLLTGRVRV